jgi:aspartyl protease family protein
MLAGIMLATVLLAALILLLFGQQDLILGLRPDDFGSVAWRSAWIILLLGSLLFRFRGRFFRALQAFAAWSVILILLVNGYFHRFDLGDMVSHFLVGINPGLAISDSNGNVTVSRAMDNHFLIRGSVNGVDASFIFDTGASAVSLTQSTAVRAGLDPNKLVYSKMISTANGRTMVAPVTIDRLAIGDLVERNIPAMVAKPGSLDTNLLGMTFLNRLKSFEVQSDRLILRPR